MLSVLDAVEIASDPYMPAFHALRDAIMEYQAPADLRTLVPAGSPFQDYYFGDRSPQLLDLVQSATLGLPLSASRAESLIERIRNRMEHEAADLMPRAAELMATNFVDLFAKALCIIAETRQTQDCKWVGFKDVWIIEFFALLAEAFPTARFIVIMRDPRGVIASMLGSGEKDRTQLAHTLSFLRHWRKCAAFAHKFSRQPLFRGRLYIVNYEALVAAPEAEARRMCGFLAVEFKPEMLVTERFQGFSETATPAGNSSFEPITSGIQSSLASRWRSYLPNSVRSLTEFICGPEMALAGYRDQQQVLSTPPNGDALKLLLEQAYSTFSWRSDFQDLLKDYGYELFRFELLRLALPVTELDSMLVRRCFLFESVYDALRLNQPMCV